MIDAYAASFALFISTLGLGAATAIFRARAKKLEREVLHLRGQIPLGEGNNSSGDPVAEVIRSSFLEAVKRARVTAGEINVEFVGEKEVEVAEGLKAKISGTSVTISFGNAEEESEVEKGNL